MKTKTDPTARQVGGYHYSRLPYQPIRLCAELRLDFFRGNIIKYLIRAPHKGGRIDLEKARHYCQLAYHYAIPARPKLYTHEECNLIRFAEDNALTPRLAGIVTLIVQGHWRRVEDAITDLLALYPKDSPEGQPPTATI